MFQFKKRRDHAESDIGSLDTEEQALDFAWYVFIGMQAGYSEKEVSRMYLGKWEEIFYHFKWLHNMRIGKRLFREQTKTSLLDL